MSARRVRPLRFGDREYEVVFLDLWKTLARGPYPEPIMDLQCLLGYNCPCGPHSLKAPDPEFLRVCLTTGEKDPSKYILEIARKFDLPEPSAETIQLFTRLVQAELSGLCAFMDVTRQVRALKRHGVRLGLLSNVWPFPVDHFLRAAAIADCFEQTILSCDVGIAKPDVRIYQHAANQFGVAPEKCLMIGDNPQLDIFPALSCGMGVVLIDRYMETVGQTHSVHFGTPIVHSLREIL